MSLFGTGGSAPPAGGATGFGRSVSFTEPQASKPSFSFGAQPAQAPAANTPKPGLFGTAPAPAAPAQGSTGLFGQQGAQPAKPGLFGAPAPSGLFGSAGGASAAAPQPQGTQAPSSLFGAPKPAGQPGLFGAPTQNTSSGLLGQSQPAAPGLFGASTQPTPSTNAPAMAGPSWNTPAPASSALMTHPYYQRERFNDLPDAQRTLLEEMDTFMRTQTNMKNILRARDVNSEPRRIPSEVHELSALQQSLAASLESDVLRLQTIVARVERDRIDHLQLHQIAQHAKDRLGDGSGFVDWLRHFYERAAEEDVARIHRYRVTMDQVERHLLSLDQREQFAPQVISEIIHDQNASFMGLAEQIAGLHAEIETLKKDYVKWYQNRFQSVRDPFAPGVSVADGA